MLIDIRRFFQGKEKDIDTKLILDFSNESFPSGRIPKPINASVKACLNGSMLLLNIEAEALIEAECARCLAPLTSSLTLSRSFSFKQDELMCDEPEFPVTADNKLDVKELVYTELVLEVPTILLCSKNCKGLCQVCGAKKGQCSCKNPGDTDPRLAILEQLLS